MLVTLRGSSRKVIYNSLQRSVVQLLPVRHFFYFMFKNRVKHPIYYVYIVSVDRKFVYYGITSDYERRKKEHFREISKLLSNPEPIPLINQKNTFHHRIASFLRKKKRALNPATLQLSICYTSSCLEDAMDVELFLIRKSLSKNKYCCNTKSTF